MLCRNRISSRHRLWHRCCYHIWCSPIPEGRCRTDLWIAKARNAHHKIIAMSYYIHITRTFGPFSKSPPTGPPMGGGTGEGGGDRTPANFSTFNIMPMGVAWKESTSNGPHPPNRRAVAPPLGHPMGHSPRSDSSAKSHNKKGPSVAWLSSATSHSVIYHLFCVCSVCSTYIVRRMFVSQYTPNNKANMIKETYNTQTCAEILETPGIQHTGSSWIPDPGLAVCRKILDLVHTAFTGSCGSWILSWNIASGCPVDSGSCSEKINWLRWVFDH